MNLFRDYVLSISNKKRFEDALTKSACGGSSSSDIKVVISRGKAAKFTQAGECDTKGLWSVFGQVFRSLHNLAPSKFRNNDQLWMTTFAGERGNDFGGLYRETWTIMAKELMSSTLPLLIAPPNLRSMYGQNRDSWVLNPDARTVEQTQMFEFFGKLMGIAVRSETYMDINLNPMVWKLIVGEIVTIDDYGGVDAMGVKNLRDMKTFISADEFDSVYGNCLVFTTVSLSGSTIELHPGGACEYVTFDTLSRYCQEIENYWLTSMQISADSIRRLILV